MEQDAMHIHNTSSIYCVSGTVLSASWALSYCIITRAHVRLSLGESPLPPHLTFLCEGSSARGHSSPLSILVFPPPGHLYFLLSSVVTL